MEITVGIDIGTTSVKAIAADADGTVVARSRVPHEVAIPAADRFQHDAAVAWRTGTRRALVELGDAGRSAVGISVAAMVPSLAAVDAEGMPLSPGLLYGDVRGRNTGEGTTPAAGEFVAFLAWLAQEYPDATGYWPAQTVANYELGAAAVLDTTTAAIAHPLFDWTGWDESVAREAGVSVQSLPKLVPTGLECARVDGDGPVLASGCIDALAEQLVAGADTAGDVLVILGTTLIVWVVVAEHAAPSDAHGFVTIPHTSAGHLLVGGPSNAGGLFVNWAVDAFGATAAAAAASVADPGGIPVWAPYPRGERSPLDDPSLRATLADLDLTHGPAAIRRAGFEASAFVVRRAIEASGVPPRRVVATGGGIRVDEWVQALADGTDLPVDCVGVPEGGALGSAFLARVAAGLETSMLDAGRWASTARRIEPDRRWVAPMAQRYTRFCEVAGAVTPGRA